MRKIINSEAGYSLIEMILVIIFLGVALIASMNMMSSSISGSMNIEIITDAVNLANEKMEQILADKRSKGYASIIQSNYPLETNPGNFTGFTRSVTVTSFSTYKQVVVTLSHNQIDNYLLTVMLTNY